MDLVMFIGLQGAGKTSFFRARFALTHVHVSKDLYPRSARNKGERQAREIEAALAEGRSVVVDNTNPTRVERAELVALAHRYGARRVGYYFQSVLADCLERNEQRAGRARIPDVGLYSTSKLLELPSFAEGFDELFYVQLGERQEFHVSPWRETDEARDA
ncbi:MAG TPA: kinase [Planctomycetes bacterium]|nr:kinase [Planctomycetota bacterium]